jgi:hypothetical protein
MEKRYLSKYEVIVYKNGTIYNKNGKKLTATLGKNGYYYVTVCKGGRKNKKYYVHRLLAEAFIPNPLNLPTVNHKNGVKQDNSLSNLEWASYGDQIRHRNQVLKKGIKKRKYDDIFVLKALVLYFCGYSITKIAKHYKIGVSQLSIYMKKVSNNYGFGKVFEEEKKRRRYNRKV